MREIRLNSIFLVLVVLLPLTGCLQATNGGGGASLRVQDNPPGIIGITDPPAFPENPIRILIPSITIDEAFICRSPEILQSNIYGSLTADSNDVLTLGIYGINGTSGLLQTLGASTTVNEIDSATQRSYLTSNTKFYITKEETADGFPATLIYRLGNNWIPLSGFFCNSTGHSEDNAQD